MRIADGDPVKLARMLEIQSWFDNKDQLAATATSMGKYLQQSEKAAILPEGVAPEYIELLLWAMEQTDSPNPIMRCYLLSTALDFLEEERMMQQSSISISLGF